MRFWNNTHRNAQLALFTLLLSGAHTGAMAAAEPFIEYSLESPYTLIAAPIAADVAEGHGKEILLFTVDEKHERYLLVFQFDAVAAQYKAIDQVLIAPYFHSYDISEFSSGSPQTLAFLASHELAQYQAPTAGQAGAIEQQIKLNTLVLKENADFLARGRFIKDINRDQFPDLIVADFESTQVYLGSEKGYKKQILPIKADVVIGNRGATYSNPTLYLADVNQDQRLDIIEVETGTLLAYLQDANHIFAQIPSQFALAPNINGTEWWHKRDSNGEELDQSNLTYRKVDEIKDLNNDGLPDMVVRFTQSSGVLDRSNDYEVYLGQLINEKFSLPLKPNSTIKADGTLSGIEFIDINGDDKFEVLLSGFDIGLSQIIGALISGSINQDVYIFAQDETSNFNSKPIMKEDVNLKFSLSSGRSGSSVVALADINGDGYKELLLSKNTKALSIFTGKAGVNAFEKRAIRYKTQLAEDNSKLSVVDINDDNKDDILFYYGKLDDEALAKTIRILIAKQEENTTP